MTPDFEPIAVDLAREPDFDVGSLRVRPSTRQVEAAGESETIEPRVMQVLVALARRRGEVVSRDELTQSCWSGRIVGDDALIRCIVRVRKLGETHGAFSLEAIPRVGYRLMPLQAATGAAATPVGVAPARRIPGWRTLGLAGLVFLLAVAIFALWSRGAGAAREPSIAVLPFANLSGDPERDYLSRAIAMEIIERLSQLDGMEVISRNSSFTFGADADAREVGENLKVAHVLNGSVREEGGRILITAELVDARSGKAIWTQPYQTQFTAGNLDATQRQIAQHVSGAMSIAFDVKKRARPSGSGTQSLEAYDFYLRGLDQWWYRRDSELSASLFARAVEIDPNYADAWAGRAIALASAWGLLAPAESRAQQDSAYVMAKRAVELDPDLSVAQSIFGAISSTQGKWSEAETATRRALEISRTEMALNNRQMLLLRTGRLADAHALILELKQVDPVRGSGDIAQTFILSALGKHDELRKIMAAGDWTKTDDSRRRAYALMARIHAGDPPAVIRQGLESIAQRPENEPSAFARAVLEAFDDREEARAVLRSWYEDANFQHFYKWDLIPHLAAWYGDTDLVLRIWREELPIHTPRTAYMWGPAFAAARLQPEFKTLMKDIGLVEYWRPNTWPDRCRPKGESDFECT